MIDIAKLISIQTIEISKESIPFSKNIRNLCKMPYPGHPKGCPNYGTHKLCPPKARYQKDTINNFDKCILLIAKLDFKTYKSLRKESNPNLTDKQVSCCLYYQNSVKKILKNRILKLKPDLFFGCGPGFLGSQSMESAGINVFGLLKRYNIPYEIKPKDTTTFVCLLLYKNKLKVLEKYGKSIQDIIYNDEAEKKAEDLLFKLVNK